MLWSIIPLRTVAGVWMSEFRDLPSLVCSCFLSIPLRTVAGAWMSEFRDFPSLVYTCFLSIPLRYGAHLLCLFQWAGQLDEFVRGPARVLPRPAVRRA